MKHQTPDSMKFRKLARRLGLRLYEAVGVLELLWLVTQKNAPRGDIGRYDNEEIAIALDWQGDPDELVATLVDCGWLDESREHRLIVHDWHEHAPRYVHGVVAKSGGFVTTVADYSEPLQSVTTVGDCSEGQPNLTYTKPNVTKPKKPPAAESPELPEAIAGDEMLREAVEDWLSYKAERRERFKPRGLKAFYGEVANAAARHGPVEVVRAIQTAMANNWQGWTHGLGQESRAGPRGGGRRHTEITPL